MRGDLSTCEATGRKRQEKVAREIERAHHKCRAQFAAQKDLRIMRCKNGSVELVSFAKGLTHSEVRELKDVRRERGLMS